MNYFNCNRKNQIIVFKRKPVWEMHHITISTARHIYSRYSIYMTRAYQVTDIFQFDSILISTTLKKNKALTVCQCL